MPRGSFLGFAKPTLFSCLDMNEGQKEEEKESEKYSAVREPYSLILLFLFSLFFSLHTQICHLKKISSSLSHEAEWKFNFPLPSACFPHFFALNFVARSSWTFKKSRMFLFFSFLVKRMSYFIRETRLCSPFLLLLLWPGRGYLSFFLEMLSRAHEKRKGEGA